MTTVVVLDPGIVFGAVDEIGLSRLQEWTKDRRVRLGARTWDRLAEAYATGVLGTPQSLRRIAHRTFGDLLTRQPLEHSELHVNVELSSSYQGESAHRELLIDDLVGVGLSTPGSVLGTVDAFWGESFTAIGCVPPPPTDLAVHFGPNLPTPHELRDRRAAWFSGRRLLIVGGQVDEGITNAIGASFDVPPGDVRWIPSEKNKRARNLKSVIQGLPSNAVVVCVVGKVGHDVSGEVKDYTRGQSLHLCESRFATQIVDDLTALVDLARG
ncbi:hypothetical protein [Microbacterium murale]|uniref:Uncharacterized protein n=1 Tax=Microbacterium murale TaxID=1081040 RepID=A0ABQ1S4W4_9MICO|nr:hypothetical protein [Microbacterium murale]GGD89632.1 hypothetical protein GCM10007269_35330 [Microbacterium murale]